DVREIGVGVAHACAVKNDDTLVCWGQNIEGLLGHDPEGDSDGGSGVPYNHVPTPVPGLTNVAHVALGHFNTCVLTPTNDGYCWADNNWGQLGTPLDASVTSTFVPQKIQGL